MSQMKIKKHQVPTTYDLEPGLKTLDGTPLQTYGGHTLSVKVVGKWGHEGLCKQDFKAADMVGIDVILGLPWSMEQNPDIGWPKQEIIWRKGAAPGKANWAEAQGGDTVAVVESGAPSIVDTKRSPFNIGIVGGEDILWKVNHEVSKHFKISRKILHVFNR